ncbi:MAG: hypothetical protein IV097_20820 [Burkholderiaceae bacterium]|nr:hypothetical protein [Burkholderiaceae bacterium]
MSDDFIAPPAFKPDQALMQLKRALRDLRPLSERGAEFILKGQTVIELSADDSTLTARLAKRPARSPEWDTRHCRSGADVRSLQDEIKKRLVRWTDETS